MECLTVEPRRGDVGWDVPLVAGQQPAKPPMSEAKGLGIVMASMIGILAVIWLLFWLFSDG